MTTKNNIKLIDCEQRSEKWHAERQGVVTGTGLKSIIGTPKVRETYFYEILAERLSTEANSDESAMDRGVRLESEAIEEYKTRTKAQISLIGLVKRKDNKWLGYSPDALVEQNNGTYEKDIEVKCLSSAKHIKTYLTKQIPEEYLAQAISGFVVNDDLKERDFVFYDPRISKIPFFVITIRRLDYEIEILEAKQKADEFIDEINNTLEKII